MQKSEFIEQVSRKMKLIRIESQYSQEEMANLLGISKKRLSKSRRSGMKRVGRRL